MTTAIQTQYRRGTSSAVAAFTGAAGELVVDTTGNRVVVQDGATAGGFAMARRAEKQRSITASGNLPITADDVALNFNNAGDLTPVIPLASGRAGAPLRLKNLPGSHLQTLTRTSPDTLEGQNTLQLAPGMCLWLYPYDDGVNSGWGLG
jgi:major tropism determinant Mtd-like protein